MSDVIIDMAMAAVLESEGQSKIKKDVLTNVRRFVESLMTTTYEGRPAELAVAVVTAKDKGQKKLDIQTLLALKKTSTLFGGHRHVLVCNQKGEVQGHSTLVPYPDVFPKRGNTPFYVAPYEYQPIMRFSDRRSALTFLLTRRHEILVIVGPQILFIRTNRGWRVLALDRFLDLLGELLWKNAKGRLSKKDAGTFAMHPWIALSHVATAR